MTKEEIFLRNVKCYAFAKDVAITKACEDVGLSRSYYSMVKRRKQREASQYAISKLAEYFEVTPEQLMAEELPEDVAKYENYDRRPSSRAKQAETMRKKWAEKMEEKSKARQLPGTHQPWYKSESEYPIDIRICARCRYGRNTNIGGLGACNYLEVTGDIKKPLPVPGTNDKATCDKNGCFYFEPKEV